MPTGYTAKLVEGEETFEEFFWRATRAMGVMIHMRETSSDRLEPPTPELKKSIIGDVDYYEGKLQEALAEAKNFNDLNGTEQQEVVRPLLAKEFERVTESLNRDLKRNKRTREALKRLEGLPKTNPKYTGFFEFLEQQLTVSLEATDYYTMRLIDLEKDLRDLPEAARKHQQKLWSSVAFYRERRADEEARRLKRVEEGTANEWLHGLTELVPCPDSVCTPEFKQWIAIASLHGDGGTAAGRF